MKQTIKAVGIFLTVVVCTYLALGLIVAFEWIVLVHRFSARGRVRIAALVLVVLAAVVATLATGLDGTSLTIVPDDMSLRSLAVPGAIAVAALIGFIAGRKSGKRRAR